MLRLYKKESAPSNAIDVINGSNFFHLLLSFGSNIYIVSDEEKSLYDLDIFIRDLDHEIDIAFKLDNSLSKDKIFEFVYNSYQYTAINNRLNIAIYAEPMLFRKISFQDYSKLLAHNRKNLE